MTYAPEEQRRLIASLKHDPPFRALVEWLEQIVEAQAEELATTEKASDVLRLTRIWQVSRKFVQVLKTAPETMDAILEQEKGFQYAEIAEHPWAAVANINIEE